MDPKHSKNVSISKPIVSPSAPHGPQAAAYMMPTVSSIREATPTITPPHNPLLQTRAPYTPTPQPAVPKVRGGFFQKLLPRISQLGLPILNLWRRLRSDGKPRAAVPPPHDAGFATARLRTRPAALDGLYQRRGTGTQGVGVREHQNNNKGNRRDADAVGQSNNSRPRAKRNVDPDTEQRIQEKDLCRTCKTSPRVCCHSGLGEKCLRERDRRTEEANRKKGKVVKVE